jgi:hypothetical protein
MLVVDITAAGAAGSRLGRYKVLERRKDGSIVLAPESVDEVIDETAERPLSGEEFLDALERLDTASAQRP